MNNNFIFNAGYSGDPELIKIAITQDRDNSVYNTLLEGAAFAGRIGLINNIMALYQVDDKAMTSIIIHAAKGGHAKLIKQLYQPSLRLTNIAYHAGCSGNIEAIRQTIELTQDTQGALRGVVVNDHADILSILLTEYAVDVTDLLGVADVNNSIYCSQVPTDSNHIYNDYLG